MSNSALGTRAIAASSTMARRSVSDKYDRTPIPGGESEVSSGTANVTLTDDMSARAMRTYLAAEPVRQSWVVSGLKTKSIKSPQEGE